MHVEWSYDYVQEQHKKLREQREQVARKLLESWLEHLVGPHLTTDEPLPEIFTSRTLSMPDDHPDAVQELALMANKLGWHLAIYNRPDPTLKHVEVGPRNGPGVRERTDSVWDIDAVRAKKQEARALRLKVAAEIVRSALRDIIGRPTGIPELIQVDVDGSILERQRSALAELGWKPAIGCFGRQCLTKL
jgi:hypothetical protein